MIAVVKSLVAGAPPLIIFLFIAPHSPSLLLLLILLINRTVQGILQIVAKKLYLNEMYYFFLQIIFLVSKFAICERLNSELFRRGTHSKKHTPLPKQLKKRLLRWFTETTTYFWLSSTNSLGRTVASHEF